MGVLVYSVIAFLLAASGLMTATSQRVAEFCAVTLFASGMSVVVLILFAAESG